MDNTVRDYAWGSTSQLAQFLGRPATGKPMAELWMGAHDGAPSRLPDGRLLNDVIADEPGGVLGHRVCDIFGERLPFLMKVLAVDQTLSLQVHPSSERARIGHARESHAEIPLDAAHRSYKDQWHKPELIYALTRFEGLAGFRDVERSAQILRLLHVRWADEVADQLLDGPAFQALRTVVTETMALSGRKLKRLLHEVSDAARHAEARARRNQLRHRSHQGDNLLVNPEASRVFARLGELGRAYPDDPGVLVTLLLNNVVLAPGEAMFVNAGVIHAYVSGFGVEIMASSDNVLRAGLTPKHMDVDELLAITNFTPIPPPRWDPAERTPEFVYIEPPVAEFCLTVGRSPLRRVPPTGPRTVLVLEGTVEVVSKTERLTATRGQSIFVSHADGPIDVQGDGRVAIGAVPT